MNAPISLPKYYIIEPTNVCNYSCPICPNRNFTDDEKGFLQWGLFESIISQIGSVACVIQLYWMGEPFSHPKIIGMIKHCKTETNAKIMLSTNGSLLTREVSEALIESGVDEIIVSLDAFDNQQLYGTIRSGGNIAQVNSNVEYLISKNNGQINIILQFIDLFINRCERELFKEKWESYDCSLSIQCLYTWSNQIPALNLASDNLSPVANKKRVPCADLWNKLCIHWDGKISACCFDWHTSLCFGDANKNSLFEIWNGDMATEMRKAHLSGNYEILGLCSQCDAWAEPEEYTSLFHLD